MLKNIINSVFKVTNARFASTIAPSSSIIKPNYNEIIKSPFMPVPREVWLENLDTEETQRLDLISLNPQIFADTPRVDIIQRNIVWQQKYKYVSFAHSKVRSEKRGGGRKPWPQKGTGRGELLSYESIWYRSLSITMTNN